ncbi:MAG: DUF1810 domain-containing protein [Bacteroidota bacterium]|jgi:uncharacterized protein (DUF1810 family)
MNEDLDRFIQRQESVYTNALNEIKSGYKSSHWIWYVFPQLKGLGKSELSNYYGIGNLNKAREYLAHPVLGPRLIEITTAFYNLENVSASSVLGRDDKKLKSCMTLFDLADGNSKNIFRDVLNKYFNGELDELTLEKIQEIS